MTGEEKAAIILLTLKEELAAEVLKNFDQVEVMRIGKAMTRIKKVTPDELREVARDFCEMAGESTGFVPINRETLKSMLLKVMDERTANELVTKLIDSGADDNPILDKLRFIDPKVLIDFTKNEHPQTIALILAHLKPEVTARILEGYSEAMQVDIVKRMANLSGVSPEIVEELATTLERDVFSLSTGAKELGGSRAVADILNSLSRGVQQSIISQLEDSEPALAAEVRDFMFNFEDVLRLDDKSLQEIIKETASADLAKALKLADDSQRERIFKNMSKRAAEILREEIQLMPPTRLSEVEACQRTITDTARALEEKGVVVIQRAGNEKDAFV